MKNKFYRFLADDNQNVGIWHGSEPQLILAGLQEDGVLVKGFVEVDSNKAICEITQRRDNPLPLDSINIQCD